MPKALNHLAKFCKSEEAIKFILWTLTLFQSWNVWGRDGQDWTTKKVCKPWGGYMHWWVCIQHCTWAAYTIYCNFPMPEIALPFDVCALFDAL
ncbi:uncharacterized protein ACA1_370930 [Acanthamoeba castellanii str. Neff]|uniref:Uncharacterized protein n=1 Tax=Acanthamoeba castellanii (strain ATCC 30010 / Neff) TaxID=1257118 RepID=L8GYD6_ACACF|nr:uncharacterized protein ACA1_370930 [Acanthamoeba castellanii str. Neff]ELR18289.1 hypothetical protein ACA1_370930 [Acanthamoeba castellanii str. Neff]